MIKTLVQQNLGSSFYRSHWAKGVVLAAWNKLFPRIKEQLKKFSLKKGIAYIQLESLILANDLRRNKAEILQKLKQTIYALGEPAEILQDIAFV